MSFHPHNLSQKTEVMVEHFRTHTRHKVGGRAKAMVVTSSRLHAVRYKQAFDKYIADKGYKDIKTLVAFSGSVEDPDVKGKMYTEVGMNHGIKEKELPEKFSTDEYQVLLVAEKYQTGCGFRSMSATHSDSSRPPIPIQAGHLFRLNPATP